MNLKEKLADEYAMEQLKVRPLQPFEDYYKTTRAFEEGFEKAREMATEVVSRNLGDSKHYAYEILPFLGEEEV